MRSRLLVLLPILFLCAVPLFGQTANDSSAIRSTALDFIEGWYESDPVRFKKSLHDELISKVVTSYSQDSSKIENFSAELLIRLTGRGGGRSVSKKEQRKDIEILDIYQNAASVKIHAYDAMEYLHMAKWKGEWKIINILFERTRK